MKQAGHKDKYWMTSLVQSSETSQNQRQSGMGAARGLGEVEKGSYYLMGIEFEFYKMENIKEMDGGVGCKTL